MLVEVSRLCVCVCMRMCVWFLVLAQYFHSQIPMYMRVCALTHILPCLPYTHRVMMYIHNREGSEQRNQVILEAGSLT